MKKKTIHTLKLKKTSLSALNTQELKGGTNSDQFCQSVNSCETIDYTRCYGANQCGFYNTNNCGR